MAVVVHALSPTQHGEVDRGGSLGPLASHSSLVGDCQANERETLSQRTWVAEDDTQASPLASTHMFTYIYTCVYSHIHK